MSVPVLSGAHRVDIGQALHGVGLLDQRATLGQGRGAGGVGEGNDEEEPVGDLSGQDRGDLDDAGQGERLEEGLEEDGEGHQRDDQRDGADDEVDPGAAAGSGSGRRLARWR